MIPPKVLVACVGNIFLGDDAFGVEVAQKLLTRSFPQGVRVADFGIRGLDLVYALLDGCETMILVDAVPRGGQPGTIYLLEPRIDPSDAPPLVEGHSMDPVKVLRMAVAMGANPRRVFIVGCEPTPASCDQLDAPMELSPPVRAAVDEAVAMLESLIEQVLSMDHASETNHLPGGLTWSR